MKELTSYRKLQRAPRLRLEIDSSNTLRIFFENRVVQCGPHGLSILETFAHPTTLFEAIATLQNRVTGAQDWMDLTSTILRLHDAGILQTTGRNPEPRLHQPFDFDAVPIHIAMLNDRKRTGTYLAAIEEIVRPGDVVVDVGTGTGVLAVASALRGAKHVYAIEAGTMGDTARKIFEISGLAGRITLLPGWSTQMTMPEPADVLVSEIVGEEPLAERVLEVTLDARKRFLKSDARFLPRKIGVFGQLIALPRLELEKWTVTENTVRKWRSWYGMDFSPLADLSRTSPQVFGAAAVQARTWPRLSEAFRLAEIDLQHMSDLVVDGTATVECQRSGFVDAVLLYFQLEVSPTAILSTHPDEAAGASSWCNPIWIVSDRRSLQRGDRVRVTYRHGLADGAQKLTLAPAS